MDKRCSWPFHSDPECESCKDWESKNSQAIDDYLTNLEIRQAARRAERAARSHSRTNTSSETEANG